MSKHSKNGNGKSNDHDPYIFRLYVTGASPNSLRAIANTRELCEEYFNENYELEIIDVHQQPSIAKKENIIALPLLIKKHPLPEKRLIGDMSDMERVLKSFGLTNIDL
ncbi:MAG TPA: circadian clock KaiB family protein [Chitinophagaceae bacterium]|jgi:circadian clock protein KaiB|nr:circadian clock KaiB family protein [Chitinophagaceae bacterium]